MPVSRKKYQESEERCEIACRENKGMREEAFTLREENKELRAMAENRETTIDSLIAAMEATLKNQMELYLRLCKVTERRNHWRAEYEGLARGYKYHARTLHVLTNQAAELDRLKEDNESLVAEGAKLADELKELRKEPEIVGSWILFAGGKSLYWKGCVNLQSYLVDDGRAWLRAIDDNGRSLASYVADTVVGYVPEFAKPKPAPKKASKPAATKKRARR